MSIRRVTTRRKASGEAYYRSRVLAGNAVECRTLEDMLKDLGVPAGAMIVMDRGIASEENLAWLREKGYRYLVVSRERARCMRPVLAAEPEGRLAAIVDFTFNLGAGRLQTSTLRRRVNQRNWAAAAMELRRWVYGGGRLVPGQVTRWQAEAALLL